MNVRASRPALSAVLAVIALQLVVPAVARTAAVAAPAAAPLAAGAITLHVQSARSVGAAPGFVHKGDPVATYKWLINKDDTGDPGTAANQGTENCLPATAGAGSSTVADFAATCPWPSIRNTSGQAPIMAQGDQADLADSKALSNLPGGKYLISVTADGFKIGGAHFTVNGGALPQRVTVELDPTPLPLTTLRIQVFNDNAPVDATYEVDAERGLAGFTAALSDVLGLVSTDYYMNPLCTAYVHDGAGKLVFDDSERPVIDAVRDTGKCTSDSTGLITIPNMGPNRYGATVTPPPPVAGQTYQWVQTTSLEGGHDHDIWQQEGETGFDTEQLKGAELVPSVQFGFVRTQALPTRPAPTGELKGRVVAQLPYIGGVNGQVNPHEIGSAGAKLDGPIPNPWIALSNLGLNDQQVYVGRGAADGSFDLKNVPVGDYQLTAWDDDQDYILWSFNVTVRRAAVTDAGAVTLVGWFTHVHGKVFIDNNGNGRLDAGEQGVAAFPLTVRERDNSLMDQMTNTATTDSSGTYDIREVYPLGKWLVMEGFDTRYKSTGITYRAPNEPTATTLMGAAVDINFMPTIGLGTQIDWGVQPYDRGTNGGIVGTVTYDTTRNELDAADAATEPYQPGIAGVGVRLFASVPCPAGADVANECRQGKQIVPLNSTSPNRGAFVKGPELQDTYTSEEWQPPRGCTARMYDGQPLVDQQALPAFGTTANNTCVEAPMMGVVVGASEVGPDGFGQTVNGNYGFGTSLLNQFAPGDARNPAPAHDLALYANLAASGYPEQDLLAADYIVSVDIPDNPVGGKPMYKVTKEEDVNVFDGDTYLPQENFPPATPAEAAGAAGPGDKLLDPPSQPPSQTGGIVSPCVGPLHKVTVTNPTFLDGGGSPFEGYEQPLCSDKLVTVRDSQSTAPGFSLFTDVPLPTHFWGLTLNDLGLTLDKRSVNYGEAQGIPFVPVGLYNWDGRLLDTVHTDFNGLYEALEPSTGTFNCPVPAGPCPNMYRFVGNDPGRPGHLNPDYNPRFRTIATNFQAWPGLYTVTDEAPTQVAATALAPDTTVANPTMCDLGATVPQLLAVDKPYVRKTNAAQNVTVTGFGFGATQGAGSVTLTGGPAGVTPISAGITSWSDTSITFSLPANYTSGPAQLNVTNGSGFSSVNALTVQLLDAAGSTAGSSATNPQTAEVGPGKAYATVKAALEAALPTNTNKFWLVVVWPNTATTDNPRGEYTENVVLHHRVRVQGVGPGGFQPNGTWVPGSILDGAGFNPDNQAGTDWINLVGGLNHSGNPDVPTAAVVTVLDDPQNNRAPVTYYPSLDGFTITGGSQSDYATTIDAVTGVTTTPANGAGALITQGGGVYVHANVRNLHVTNNVIRGNSGSYGGGIRLGTPYVGDNRNYGIVLAHNQIRDNGGTNLAGGIGLFTGSDGYSVTDNAICGNFSSEYGGGISSFGYQTHATSNGTPLIARNRIWFNQSYDEGGGIMIAGELPADPNGVSEGSGAAVIDRNVIQANLANDDGGGIRLLQVTGSHVTRATPGKITITNDTIANNVSAHEGGGIALDDAIFVDILNSTIVKNITTATAVTSDGRPAPAGLSSSPISTPLRNLLKQSSRFPGATEVGSLTYSKPTLLNDVFWDNRAGTFSGGWVYGIGKLPDGTTSAPNVWDMGLLDDPNAQLSPKGSVLQSTRGTDITPAAPGSNTVTASPGLKTPYDVSVNILAFRSYPAFRQAVIVTELLPPNLMGDYHQGPAAGSAARGRGLDQTSVIWGSHWTDTVFAPSPDIDGDPRPTVTGNNRRYDAGSDQAP